MSASPLVPMATDGGATDDDSSDLDFNAGTHRRNSAQVSYTQPLTSLHCTPIKY